MQLEFGRPIHLCYCSNIHPGESWAETRANLQTYTVKIREALGWDGPFGIGLRISDAASRDLIEPGAVNELKDFLDRNGLYVFTINAFPFGRFHGARVKEQVFAPDWTTAERLEYTVRCAKVLAQLLPPGGEGSVSTLPASFKAWITEPRQIDLMVERLSEAAAAFAEISEAEGKSLHLGLEPEPMGYVETIGELVEFFDKQLRVGGVAHLVQSRGYGEAEALEIINGRLGICYDTCHMAVEFHEPGPAIDELKRAGILISKIQISSALRLPAGEEAFAQLRRFADETYLHQVIARFDSGHLKRWTDIKLAMDDRAELEKAEEIRVHCHVPLTMTPRGPVASTSDHIAELMRSIRPDNPASHFEIETYTWDVLPDDAKGKDLVGDVAGEIRWFVDLLKSAEHDSSADPQ